MIPQSVHDLLAERRAAEARYQRVPQWGRSARRHLRWITAWASADHDGDVTGPRDPGHWAHAACSDLVAQVRP